MIEFLGLLFVSLIAALAGAVVPGPVFVVTVSESLKRGRFAGPLIVIGHFMVEAVIIVLIFLGLEATLESNTAKLIVSYLGGTALILMGTYLVKASRNIHVKIKANANLRFASHGPIIAGFLTSCSNPYITLWWLTIGIPVLLTSISTAGIVGFFAFLIGHAAADLGWFGFVSYSINAGKNFLSRRTIRYIVLGSAIFLMIFGFLFIFSAYMP
jgi:threonine/homoserine/homoserine lactone efflux protein